MPAELLNLGHDVWRDPDLFTAWCERQGIEEPRGRTWAERFQRGRDAWAAANGFTRAGSTQHVDQLRLITELHIPWCGSLTRSMARAEAESDGPGGIPPVMQARAIRSDRGQTPGDHAGR